ncbi:hypothetical protein ACFVFI_35560 [Streptomyces sp. NPDC057705]|uniref:hypothetical protein n=1 Tax=Streptomyces sp. NPDC057705 TaxID=3346222 RepID=UPI0036B9AE27
MAVTELLHDTVLRTIETLGPVGTLVVTLFLLLYAGVVLPAVWSRHAYRRSAARTVLASLGDALGRLARAVRHLMR